MFKSDESRKFNALPSWHFALTAEGEEWLVGHDQEENWSDTKDRYVHLEGCSLVVKNYWWLLILLSLRVTLVYDDLPSYTGYEKGTVACS